MISQLDFGLNHTIWRGISALELEESVFGSTNSQFIGTYAEHAVAEAAMLAPKLSHLTQVEAVSALVVA